MKPPDNKLLYNEVVGITNDFRYISNRKVSFMKKDLDTTKLVLAKTFCQPLGTIVIVKAPLYLVIWPCESLTICNCCFDIFRKGRRKG